MGCQFDSSMYHNKSTIGEEGNSKPPHQTHFPRKTSEPCHLWFLLSSKSSMKGSSIFATLYLSIKGWKRYFRP